MIVINDSLIQNVQDPYISVSQIIDLANRRIRNTGYSKIPVNAVLEILRLTRNELYSTINLSRNSYIITTVVNQNSYILDVPNLKNVIKVFDEQYVYNFVEEKDFDYITGESEYKVFTLKQTDSYYMSLSINPAPSDVRDITLYYYSAGNEVIDIDTFLNIPNNLYTYFFDSFVYRLIEDLDTDDMIKRAELTYYYQKHIKALGKFKAHNDGRSSNVFAIKYEDFKQDPDNIPLT